MKTKLNLFRALLFCAVTLATGLFFSVTAAEEPTISDANWSTPGWRMNNAAVALAVSGSNLYAGGYFTMVGGSAVNYIAKWNGSSWSALGSGMNGNVWALAVTGSNLYAGGFFSTAGDKTANHIAEWNGSDWSALGFGMDNRVSALAVSGSDV